MADPITLIVELQEKVSGPAERAHGAIEKLEHKAEGLAVAFGRLISPAVQGRDEMGHFTEKVGALDGAMEAVAGPVLAVGAAIAAMGAITVGVSIALATFALEAVEAKEKALATLDALAGGSDKAEELYAALGNARDGLGMTRAELLPLTDQLLGMGVAVDALPSKLKALATIKAIGIEGGPEEFLAVTKQLNAHVPVSSKMLANLYKTGINVNEVAAAMGLSVKALQTGLKNGTVDATKFGDALTKAVTDKGATALANQARELGTQWANFKESIGDLFADVDVAPFLDGLHEILGLFSQGTASGKTLKAGITGALNGIFVAASKALPYIKVGIEKFIIVALKAYILVKTHWTTISTVMKVVALAIGAVVGVVALVGAAFVAVVVAIGVATGAFVLLLGAIVAFVVKAGVALFGWAVDAGKAAIDFVMGLVNGIKNGTGLAVEAVKGLGKSVLGGMKSMLGIASPSKEFAKLGMHAGAGFAAGLDAATADVSVSAQSMGAAATQSASPVAARGQSSGGGGGTTVTFAPGSIVIDGAGKSASELTETMIATVFERIALTQGLGV